MTFNGGENVPTAQRVVIPYQGALEVLEEPIIAKPSDILRFQGTYWSRSNRYLELIMDWIHL